MEKQEGKNKCQCGTNGHQIVMSCSGASDVGFISDKVARALHVAGKRKMSCLAVVGAGIEKSIQLFKTKDILVIDGCPTACGKRMMEQQGIEDYQHLVVTDLGLKKGASPASEENVGLVIQEAIKK